MFYIGKDMVDVQLPCIGFAALLLDEPWFSVWRTVSSKCVSFDIRLGRLWAKIDFRLGGCGCSRTR